MRAGLVDACRIGIGDKVSGGRNFTTWRIGANRDDLPPTHGIPTEGHNLGRWPANVIHDGSDEVMGAFPHAGKGNGTGAYSYAGREFHYAATSMFNGDKPQAASNYNDAGSAARFFYCAKASKTDRSGSKHPTIKPIALMRYLCRLITPPGGIILDPFAGSGTTGQAAVEEGFDAILIEREAEYCDDIRRRLVLHLDYANA